MFSKDYNYNVSLAHTSIIHITVIATNAAGLMREAHAEDLLVDLTPPEILLVKLIECEMSFEIYSPICMNMVKGIVDKRKK
jgi:hypothetical protein